MCWCCARCGGCSVQFLVCLDIALLAPAFRMPRKVHSTLELPVRVQKIGFSLLYWEPGQAQGLANKRMLALVPGKKPKMKVFEMRLVLVPWWKLLMAWKACLKMPGAAKLKPAYIEL